jgi:hypothetical protein
MSGDTILSVWRAPFSMTPEVRQLPAAMTLAELAAAMPGLPHDFDARGVICINGRPVYRSAWRSIRPKPRHNGVPVEVTFHAPPMGGGGEGQGGGGKRIFALVASIGLSIISGGILAGGAAKFLGAGFAAKTLGAAALSFGVSLTGALLIGALSAPPVAKPRGEAKANEGAASAEGNVLEANAAIPRVYGERKVFPPLGCEPLTYFDGPDEIVEAVYVLAGPHRIEGIRIGNAEAAGLSGVDVEMREGWPGDVPLRLVTRQGRTESVQAELRAHLVEDSDGQVLDVSAGDVSGALPQPYVVVTRDGPDVHWLHLAFPQGLNLNASEGTLLRVPMRLRIRELGSATWVNLPELHFQAANVRQLRATIELVWTDAATADPQAAAAEGFVEARRVAPGQTVAPVTEPWAADAYFGASGDAWMVQGNAGTTGVEHVECSRFTARILLDTGVFPKGRYEIEILRGAAFGAGDYDTATYVVAGDVWNLFGYQGVAAPRIVRSRDGVADSLYLLRSVSVWNEHPVPTDDLALIAVRARNRALEALSCVAGGWVRDWDGAEWNTLAVTGNPAPHLRDIYLGLARPVPPALIDSDALVSWRSACIAAGYTVNHVMEDESMMDTARIVAGCGYGQPYMSEVYGVVRDKDRSAEVPVQIFTPRNSRNFGFTRALPNLPEGFRVNYRDALRDYETRQIVVARPGFAGTPVVTEQITIEGLVDEAAVRARAVYDLRTPELRGTFYTLEAPAEAIVCRRGDLVGVNHDMIARWMGSGRVVDVRFNGGGLVDRITLDGAVEVSNEPDMHGVTDMHAVADMHLLGLSSSVVLRGPAGPLAAVAVTDASGMRPTLTLAAPVAAASVPEGTLASVGLRTSEVLRLVVAGIAAGEDLTATLTLVDEGVGLFPSASVPLTFDGDDLTFDGDPMTFLAA